MAKRERTWEQDGDGLWWDDEGNGPFDNKWRKLPYTADELIEVSRSLALSCETAGFTTICETGFPRCRTVTTGKYVAESFAEVTVATRLGTRKCSDIQSCDKVNLFWQDKSGSGAWVSASGLATFEPGENDKAKVRVRIQQVELQDYNANVTGCGTDCWKPVILKRESDAWVKVQ
eukprot:TRINITY_DN42852_c0_g1_i1.p1 TRINITY_DN42852_c0_g1~~TRINITY_DN42852_c0_g1_i1.p1  ORF type:complete len:175 (+),score=34.11 TRINITY_DN42852_c0_g1_i1:44-568(+)